MAMLKDKPIQNGNDFTLPDSDLLPSYSHESSKKRVCRLIPSNSTDNVRPAWLRKKREQRLHATSYLDGLRGLASFFVYIHHSSLALFPWIRLGYGAPAIPPYRINHDYLIQLPFLRIIFTGSSMVAIFFVISGAVLSIKPLRLAREGDSTKLLQSLSSSTFRRGPRLFIPCIVSTFFTALASITGLMLERGITRHYPLSASNSWVEQFSVWLESMLDFVRPGAWGTMFEQNLWTIPIEFRGSLMVFICALGVANLRTNRMRTISLLVLNLYWIYLAWWEMVLFLSGMLMSDLSLYRTEKPVHSRKMKLLHHILFIFAVYLLSMPENGENVGESAYGYSWFSNKLTPNNWVYNHDAGRFWTCIGAVLLVGVQTHAGPDSFYQRFFTGRFMQYLGEISFSFYLWHGLVIYTLGAHVMTYMIIHVGFHGSAWWFSFATTQIVVLPLLFWIADLSTVYVDKAAVNIGKRLAEM